MTRVTLALVVSFWLSACDNGQSENGNRVTTKANEIDAAAEAQVRDTEKELKAVETE